MRRLTNISFVTGCALLICGPTMSADSAPPKRYTHAFPVSETAKTLEEAYLHPQARNGSWVSIQGRVANVLTDSHGRSAIQLQVDSPSTRIWATWSTRVEGDFIKIGDTIRIGGWLMASAEWTAQIQLNLPDNNSLTLVPICLVKVQGKDQLFDKKYLEYCEVWRDGERPPDMDVESKQH